ncbi:hypothetical protein Ancab_038785 [Ancistrocladus abbreviatus]
MEHPPRAFADLFESKQLNSSILGKSLKVVDESREQVSLSLSSLHSEKHLFRSSSPTMRIENEHGEDRRCSRSRSELPPTAKAAERKQSNLGDKKMARDAKHEAVKFKNENNQHYVKQRRIDGGYNDNSPVVAALEKSDPRGLGRSVEARKENASKRLKAEEEADGMNMMRQMPSVKTTGNCPNGTTIHGFLYKFDEHHLSIVCLCHGSFHTPEEFVKHAGGDNVPNPLKHIIVCPYSSEF